MIFAPTPVCSVIARGASGRWALLLTVLSCTGDVQPDDEQACENTFESKEHALHHAHDDDDHDTLIRTRESVLPEVLSETGLYLSLIHI